MGVLTDKIFIDLPRKSDEHYFCLRTIWVIEGDCTIKSDTVDVTAPTQSVINLYQGVYYRWYPNIQLSGDLETPSKNCKIEEVEAILELTNGAGGFEGEGINVEVQYGDDEDPLVDIFFLLYFDRPIDDPLSNGF